MKKFVNYGNQHILTAVVLKMVDALSSQLPFSGAYIKSMSVVANKLVVDGHHRYKQLQHVTCKQQPHHNQN